ncbi:MAG: 3-deoxy-7-phosphoheptulonate synthase [Candidatus Omnitrophota bacterium]|jgi:3-deoxy-7-phosphoheptulonate synthase|nr:MAG: 3-deoxy-7-phosphoheptulonate synthase [Candidatus Omnitrophota bacterium]
MQQTQDLHVLETVPLLPPNQIKEEFPMSEASNQTVVESRQVLKKILRDKERRFLVIVGPCSIHDETAAYEYAERLKQLREKVEDRLVLLMRVYFEKPRTTIGWKGLIYDPELNGSDNILEGIRKARKILAKITDMRVPTATEFLDPVVPQYIADFVSWVAIGARTTESQTHREMSSGLSMPVGYKNTTSGNLQIAIDAMCSSRSPHSFLGVDQEGRTAIVKTSGNVWGHIILRGGHDGPNYDRQSVQRAVEMMEKAKLPPYVMIDCSHANSQKNYENQQIVWKDVIQQKIEGNDALIGMMLESNLVAGNQKFPQDRSQLKYGVSITDACIDWEKTEELILYAYEQFCH